MLVWRLLFEALALPVPGTPVCHAPPLAKSVHVPATSDAITNYSFFTNAFLNTPSWRLAKRE
ncbi:MAG: hypothetical protein DME75_01590 [Verrucomicrobia bacterium]|nr:MAG: hypothetical protein DME75_01590 [Verrucomicrobiota bacterium]